jgi:type II secretion system protein D
LVSTIFQPQAKPAVDALAQAAAQTPAAPTTAPAASANTTTVQPQQPGETKLAPGSAQTAIDAAKIAEAAGGLMGPVQVEYVEGLDVIVLRGAERDVQRVMDIIKQIEDLSTVTVPEITIHPLKNVDSVQVAGLLQTLYQQVLGPRIGTVNITPLGKPNALLLIGRKENVKMAIELVDRLDQPVIPTSRFEVFPLKHATATEAKTLVENFLGQAQGQAIPQFPGGASNPANSYITLAPRALVVADQRSNSLVVNASPRDIAEIAALIARIDVPGAAAELKVFTIVNGDATALTEMLRSLFSVTADTSGAAPTGSLGQTSPVRMQFSVDHRTNSIIAVGSKEDLAVVEAILLRLDEGDLRERKTTVFRLNNAFAENVAQSLNSWLQTERQVETQTQATISPFEQIEREVIIVPELATNSLIVSATPRFFNEVVKIIKDLDERPPMVLIQVLIAQVALNDTDQFGVELGLQDSVLFDRSLLSDVQTVTTTTTTQGAGGQTVSTEQQNVINAQGSPGFNWNTPTTQPLGNNLSSNALSRAGAVGTQGLANFAMNRVDPTLGFSGFVFSASSDAVSILLRALQEKRRLEVLSRPQLMALDGQQGTVQVGQQVPTVTGISQTTFGQTNNIIYRDVGLILNLVPRISPDGLVVMQIMAEKSQVSTESGVPIGFSSTGQALNAPIIDTTRALTTISAMSGQTVILGGLIETTKNDIHRRVPIIADIPLLGNLFRYDSVTEGRREVLIILTPQIVYNKMDSDLVKQIESSRMSWILSDVVNVHGEAGLRSRCDEWGEGEMDSIYPSIVPQEGVLPLSPSQGAPGCEPTFTAPGGGTIVPNGGQPTPGAEPIPTPSARKSPNNDRPANASYEAAAAAPRVAPVAYQPMQAAATVSR